MILAGICGYVKGNSIGWIAVNALFGWFTLLYWCAGFGGGLPDEIWGKPAKDVAAEQGGEHLPEGEER